jgi:hypothetical protein
MQTHVATRQDGAIPGAEEPEARSGTARRGRHHVDRGPHLRLQRGPPLELWHTYVPEEMSAEEIDRADWSQYLAAEQANFDEVRAEVTAKLEVEDRIPVNRYFEGSSIHPGHFAQDWSRSYVLEPTGTPVGGEVLPDGLSLRPASDGAPLPSGCRPYRFNPAPASASITSENSSAKKIMPTARTTIPRASRLTRRPAVAERCTTRKHRDHGTPDGPHGERR